MSEREHYLRSPKESTHQGAVGCHSQSNALEYNRCLENKRSADSGCNSQISQNPQQRKHADIWQAGQDMRHGA